MCGFKKLMPEIRLLLLPRVRLAIQVGRAVEHGWQLGVAAGPHDVWVAAMCALCMLLVDICAA